MINAKLFGQQPVLDAWDYTMTFGLQDKYPEVFRILDRGGDGMRILLSAERETKIKYRYGKSIDYLPF